MSKSQVYGEKEKENDSKSGSQVYGEKEKDSKSGPIIAEMRTEFRSWCLVFSCPGDERLKPVGLLIAQVHCLAESRTLQEAGALCSSAESSVVLLSLH